jgi:glutamine transport system permease protein
LPRLQQTGAHRPRTAPLIGALLALAAMFFGASGAAAANATAVTTAADKTAAPSSLSGKTFVIGTDTTFAPFEFRNAAGELTGIDMDIIQAIAKSQGFAVEIKSLGFNAALQALSSNQVDGVIAGMSITEARKQIYDFSDPYFESGVQMAVAKSNVDIKGYEDLRGKTVTAKTGSEGETFAQSIAGQYGFTVKALDQSATMYELVKSGNAVAVFDDYPVLAYGISQNNGLKAVSEKEKGGSYGFAVNKGQNQELLAAFNTGLAELKSNGQYQEILDKYLKDPAQATQSTFWGLLVSSLPALVKGLGNTVLVTAISFAFAMLIGLFMGFLKISTNAVLRGAATAFVSVFRGTPLLVWAFFFYFGIPQLTGRPIDIWVAAVLTLSLHHRDRPRIDPVRRPGPARGQPQPGPGLRQVDAESRGAAGIQDHDALADQPADHHAQGQLPVARHRLRRSAVPGPADLCGQLPDHRNPADRCRPVFRGHHAADQASQRRG